MDFAIVELCVHDDDKMSEDVESPAEVTSDDGHLYSPWVKQLFHQSVVTLRQTFVDVCNTLRQCLLQRLKLRKSYLLDIFIENIASPPSVAL